MTIFVDMKGHMVTDAEVENLHCFAENMGLDRDWFQGPPDHKHEHYDLIKVDRETGEYIPNLRLIEIAFRKGARVVSSRKIVEISRGKRAEKHQTEEAQAASR